MENILKEVDSVIYEYYNDCDLQIRFSNRADLGQLFLDESEFGERVLIADGMGDIHSVDLTECDSDYIKSRFPLYPNRYTIGAANSSAEELVEAIKATILKEINLLYEKSVERLEDIDYYDGVVLYFDGFSLDIEDNIYIQLCVARMIN